MPGKRCPNGTRKNKQGDCVKTVELDGTIDPIINHKVIKRCPKGTRKNKEGDCVADKNKTQKVNPPIDPTSLVKEKSATVNSIRTQYAKTYFTNPVMLLGTSSKKDGILFQVTYSSVDQFKNYANLSKKPKLDCFFQSLFALGLRNVDLAKKNAESVNKNAKEGVELTEAARFIKSSFELNDTTTVDFYKVDAIDKNGKHNNKIAKETIDSYFNKDLEDNHATIFVAYFAKNGKPVYAHYLIAYKHKNKVFYFDPQYKGRFDDKKINTKTLLNITRARANLFIYKIGVCIIKGIDEEKPLLKDDCPIRYI